MSGAGPLHALPKERVIRSANVGAVTARLLLGAALVGVLTFALHFPVLAVDDSPSYLEPARAWARGEGLVQNGRPMETRLPAYPLALGLLIRLFGGSARVFTLFQAGCHVLAVLVVRAVVARRLSVPAADAVAAAALVYPPLLTSTGLVLQETFLSLLLALVLAALWRAVESGGMGWSLLAGAALGLSALAKVTSLVLLIPAAALVALSTRGPSERRLRMGRPAAIIVGTLLVLLPWAVRNQRLLGRFGVTNANGGHTFLGGTVSNAISDWSSFPEYVRARREWQEGERERHPVLDRYLFRVGLRRVAGDPFRWAGLAVERAGRFMLPARHWFVAKGKAHMGTFPGWYIALTVFNVALFAGAGMTAWNAARESDAALMVAPLIVFGHQLVYALTYASPRYAVTVGPVLFGAAGLALARRFPRSLSTAR